MKKALTVARVAVSALVLAVAALALVAGVVLPRLGGGEPLTVTTNSMHPALPKGALVVVRPAEQYHLGEVINYQLESGKPQTATHRVVAIGITADGEVAFGTKGDNNPSTDPATVRLAQIKGKVWYHVPLLGYVSALLTGSQRQLALYLVVGLLAGYAAVQVFKWARRDVGGKHRAATTTTMTVLGIVVSGMVAFGQPAHAAQTPGENDPQAVGLSLDQVNWTSHLTTPLFAEPKLWVPGDHQTATVWFKDLTGAVPSAHAGLAFCGEKPQTSGFEVKVRYNDGEWQDAGQWHETVLEASQPNKLEIDVSLPADSLNPTELRVWPVDVQVMMVEAAGLPSASPPVPTPECVGAGTTPSPTPPASPSASPGAGPGTSPSSAPTSSPNVSPGATPGASFGPSQSAPLLSSPPIHAGPVTPPGAKLPFTGSNLALAGLAGIVIGVGLALLRGRSRRVA